MLPFFVGTHFDCKLDSKGRLSIPVKWRERLGTEFYMVSVIIRGSRCLKLYPPDEFMAEVEKMDNGTENQKYEINKVFFAQAEEGFLDAQGRFTLNNRLKESAGLANDTTVILQGHKKTIEIWDNDEYSRMYGGINANASLLDMIDHVKADGE